MDKFQKGTKTKPKENLISQEEKKSENIVIIDEILTKLVYFCLKKNIKKSN